jgi:peptide/nickel transport system permease protein
MRYLLRRIGFYLAAAFIAITLNFLIPRMMVGDPVQLMFARYQGRMPPEAMQSLKAAFGFVDAPLFEQYIIYLKNLAQGNLGISISVFPNPVGEVIGTDLVWTLRLAGIATILSFLLGTRNPRCLAERALCG